MCWGVIKHSFIPCLIYFILNDRVLDYDTYSAHDVIGKVYVDLKPLLTTTEPHIISGWFPIYDTMHGEYCPVLCSVVIVVCGVHKVPLGLS